MVPCGDESALYREHMAQQVKEGLEVLWTLNLWNRDASKSNILYDIESGSVSLIDFEQVKSNDKPVWC